MGKRVTGIGVAVLALSAGVPWASASTLQRIVVDGEFDDWADVPPAFVDPTGDQGNSVADFGTVWLANDEDYVYLRFEIETLANLQNTPGPVRIYFDLDQNPATGWTVGNIGSDFVLLADQARAAEQTDSQYEAATIGHGPLGLVSGPTVAGTQFELRMQRDTMLPIRGVPIFRRPAFDVILEGRSPAKRTEEWAPDGPAGHRYTLATGTLPAYPITELNKAHPAFVRLLQFNMLWDGLFVRPEPFHRILAALQPDIICFQEVNSSAAQVQTRLDEILPLGGSAHWQTHKVRDTVLASRWSLSMKSGDTSPPTGRGQAMALVNLPDPACARDLYVISAHYKCCGSLGSSEDVKRQTQSDANVNWFRDLREPGGSVTLPAGTPFVLAGDLNLVGEPQPLRTLITGDIVNEAVFGSDSPPDWDGSPLTDPIPHHNAAPAAHTWRDAGSSFSPGRLDFVFYSDSVARVAKSYVLNTPDMTPADLAAHGLQADDTSGASDHLPVVVDFDLRRPGDADGDGDVDLTDFTRIRDCQTGSVCDAGSCDLPAWTLPPISLSVDDCSVMDGENDGDVDLADFTGFQAAFAMAGK